MYDDVEGEGGQNKMMVGSMNAASKFTKGEGEEEQLGGTIYTKNLKMGMKMPQKIVEGRNNWLLMEKDPAYEDEDIGENCENNFEHCNEMATVCMPRDFLAKLTQYFIKAEKEDLSFFQEAQREACEIMSKCRAHWRKRKSKSASLFLSIFFLIEKEVSESNDVVCKELFVEIFSSRDEYIKLVMTALDRIDEIESQMSEGNPMTIPNWAFGDDAPDEEPSEQLARTKPQEVDVDKIVRETLDLLEDFDEVERSKYMKFFHKDVVSIGIMHNKVKTLAKQRGKTPPQFQAQQLNYPGYVTLKTLTFTKPNATSSKGAANTKAGFCTSVVFGKLSLETKKAVIAQFEIEDDSLLLEDDDEVGELELDPAASQDYPMFTQSQSAETLKVCNLCDFKTRSKADLQKHNQEHPTCRTCKKSFVTETALKEHMPTHDHISCSICKANVLESKMKSHMDNHTVTENYRKGMNKVNPKEKKPKKGKPDSSSAPRLNSYHVFCRAFREEKKRLFPQLDMIAINAILLEDWRKLSPEEKVAYKPNNGTPTVSSESTAMATIGSSESSSPSTDSSITAAMPNSESSTPLPLEASEATIDSSEPSTPPATSSLATVLSNSESTSDLLDSSPPSTRTLAAREDSGSSGTSLDGCLNVPSTKTGGYIQSRILKCATCGRMFLDETSLDEHKKFVHGIIQLTPALAAIQEKEQAKSSFYWVKLKSLLWPCKMAMEDDFEDVDADQGKVTVVIYNDKETEVDVEKAKLKEFEPLAKIPRSRTAEWKRGYEKALDEFKDL